MLPSKRNDRRSAHPARVPRSAVRAPRSGDRGLRLAHDAARRTLTRASAMQPPSEAEMTRCLAVFVALWCCACDDEVVQLYKSRRYEPISCSPNGFTLYNVDGYMWEYELDPGEPTAYAIRMGFSPEWPQESSAEKPTYMQRYPNGVQMVYDSRLVVHRGDVKTEYPIENAIHARKFFGLQNGVVSVHLSPALSGDSVYVLCDSEGTRCETSLWPNMADVVGDEAAPVLYVPFFDVKSLKKALATGAPERSRYRVEAAHEQLWRDTYVETAHTLPDKVVFGVQRDETEAGLLIATLPLEESRWRYVKLLEVNYDPFGVCREANRFPWGFGNEQCMYVTLPKVRRVCPLDDGRIIAQVVGEGRNWILLVQ